MQLNPDKCKELRISFANNRPPFQPVAINGKELAKLLGLTVSNNLTWNAYADEIIQKASKRLYYLVQLRRANVPLQDLALFYISCVRSAIDYSLLVFYHYLPQYLQNELIRLEKRAISIILPGIDYHIGLNRLCIKPIRDHHKYLCNK